MATTGTQTVRDIVKQACHEAGVTDIADDPSAEDARLALLQLNRLMKAWQAREYFDFMDTAMTVTMITGAAQTLNPVRPVWICSARFKRGTNELPMQSMTRAEYDDLPNKTTTGTPTQFYYDRQKEAAVLYVWPVLSAVDGETLEITYQREFTDLDMNDAIDLPGEWWDAAVFGTAYRLDRALRLNSPTLAQDAGHALVNVLAGQSYGSVFFCDGSEY